MNNEKQCNTIISSVSVVIILNFLAVCFNFRYTVRHCALRRIGLILTHCFRLSLSSTITAPFPSPFVATNLPYFTLAYFLSSPSFSPHPFPSFLAPIFLPLCPHSYNMSIQLLYRPALHYIQPYPRRRRTYTAATYDAIRRCGNIVAKN